MNYFEKDICNNIGKNLKKLREMNDFKQDMIGNLLGVDRSTCSNWERGITTPKNSQLLKLSKLYNVSIEFIMTCHDSDDLIVATPGIQKVFGESFLSALTDEERMVILQYRMLTPNDQNKIDKYLEELRNSDYYTKKIAEDIAEE